MVKISYNKLWKLLIDKNLKKVQLKEKAKISGYNIGRLTRGENVTVDVLAKICIALDCGFDDIIEVVDKEIDDKTNDWPFWYDKL